jgi:hypothetical protein
VARKYLGIYRTGLRGYRCLIPLAFHDRAVIGLTYRFATQQNEQR